MVPALAGAARVRVSRDGGRTYPARHEGPLPPGGPPRLPCTVPVFDAAAGTGRMLALDLDPGRVLPGAGAGERAAEVARQAGQIAGLVGGLGGGCVADVAPSGGRHVYVLFGGVLPWRELRDVARALAARYPAVDPAPMCSAAGQITPPGSVHKSGRGHRVLDMPLDAAVAAAARPCGPQVWDGLRTELAGELAALEPALTARAVPAGMDQDEAGAPWVPRPGGRVPLGADLEAVARTGTWDKARYAGRSEARMAVLTAAAARGWRLGEVRGQIDGGDWAGLRSLFERRRERRRLDRLLPAEWRKACALAAGGKNIRHWHTSAITTRPPHPGGVSGTAELKNPEYGAIWDWVTATGCAAADPQRTAGWGGQAISVRLVLCALAQAAAVAGSTVLEFGTRNLALYSGLSHRTVARVLGLLRAEDDPLIDLVSPARMKRADRYLLRVPARYADSVRWRRRRAGRIEAIHPVFATGALGGVAGLVYQVLGTRPERGAELARDARLSTSAVSDALRTLAAHGLAERGAAGWRRGPARLDDVADATGATQMHAERAARYVADRRDWHAIIDSWLAPPAVVPAPYLPLDDVLDQLDPPDWIGAGPGPPAAGDEVRRALRVLVGGGMISAAEAERAAAAQAS